MKKYPFSKKAVKAILAASIALSPFASIGGANPVAAAVSTDVNSPNYQSVEELATHLQAVYSKASTTTRQNLDLVSTAIDNVTESQWTAIAQNMTIYDKNGAVVTDVQLKVDIAKYLLSFVYTVTPTELRKTAYEFENDTALNQKIKDTLGTTITTSDLVQYALKLQLELVKIFLDPALTKEKLLSMTDAEYKQYLKEAMAKTALTNVDLSLKLLNTFDFSNYVELKNQLNHYVDPTNSLDVRNIFATAVAEYKTSSGGTGPTTPPVTPPGTVPGSSDDIKTNPGKVADDIKNKPDFKNLEVTLSNNAQDVTLPPAVVNAIIAKNKNATIEVKSAAGSYKLPAKEINLEAIAKELGGSADNVQIKIVVKVGQDSKNVIGTNKLKAVSDVVEFTVEAEVDGKKKEIHKFTTYVNRTIKGKQEFDPNKSAAIRLEENGKFTGIPAVFNKDEANIISSTNSQYTIVENDKTFNDIAKTWNKEQIEKLANKYVIQGRADGSYGPQATTTRVQLAVLLTRALALPTDVQYDGRFKDVKGDEWFVPELMAAVNAGIITGKTNGAFDSNAPVTRAQAAAMINRALEFVTYDKEAELNKTLTVKQYKDESKIQWARTDIETMLQAGIMTGRTNGTFDPYGPTTRSQMAKILDEALKTIKFINQ